MHKNYSVIPFYRKFDILLKLLFLAIFLVLRMIKIKKKNYFNQTYLTNNYILWYLT